jgi:hypothetical protein
VGVRCEREGERGACILWGCLDIRNSLLLDNQLVIEYPMADGVLDILLLERKYQQLFIFLV